MPAETVGRHAYVAYVLQIYTVSDVKLFLEPVYVGGDDDEGAAQTAALLIMKDTAFRLRAFMIEARYVRLDGKGHRKLDIHRMMWVDA